MNTYNRITRLFALLMALIMVICLVPVDALYVNAADNTPVIVIAASDYQNNNGGYFSSGASTDAYAILSAIKEDCSNAFGFLFGGDYYAHDTNTTTYSANGKKQLKEEIVDALYPNMSDDAQVYIQGNHDADSLTTNGTLATSGAHDTEHYGVYVINEKDYLWYNNSQSTIKATASALEAYLNNKMDEGYSKPIFVLSHLPLHYTNRTKNEGDGKYAKYIYDVLDEAGANDLNIIFLYGHNHSTAYDSYLGNGSVYLPEGCSISVANEGSTTSYFTDTLTFTYMNYGFVGYVGSSNADSALTMTVFELYEDEVLVKRYDKNGLHNLKSAGGNTQLPSGLSVDSTVIGTGGASIDLSAPKQKATFTSNGVTVSAVGLTGITAAKEENSEFNTALYSGYEVYTIGAEGYEEGKNAVISIELTEGDFDTTRGITVQFPDGHTEMVFVSNDTITFETNQMGIYILTQNRTTGAEIPGDDTDNTTNGKVWRQVSTLTAGRNYILVNYGDNASGVSEYAVNSSAAPTAVTVQYDSAGAFIESENMAIAWTAEANEGQCELVNVDTGNYLYISSYPSGTNGVSLAVSKSVTSGTNYSNWSLESTGSGDTALSVRRATSSNYYPVRYSAGGAEYLAYTSSQTSKHDNWIAIFEQTSEGGTSGSIIPDTADGWIHIPSGGSYVLDTDGIDTGKDHKYIIVGNNNAYALTVSNGSVNQEAVTISGNTISVDNPSIYEFYFADNSSNESKTYLLTQDGSNTVYHANGNMYYGSDNKGYWYLSSSSNGSYQIYDYDNNKWYLNYGYVWSSESTNRFAVSSNARYIRLYQCVSSVYDETYIRLAGKTEQTYSNTAGASVNSVLENVYLEVTTDGYYISDIISISPDQVSWSPAFIGNTAGTYTGTVTYEGLNMGSFTVTITNDHFYEATVVPASCTEQGYTVYTCADCGDSYVSDYVEATGHKYTSVVTSPTCTESGFTTYTCSACGDNYTDSETAALGHSYKTETVEPTCTEDGFTADICTLCGNKNIYNETDALGHHYESEIKDATCTEGGCTTFTCSSCGHNYIADETDALGHKYSSVVTEATCETDGFTTHTCSVCGDITVDSIVSAPGHNYETETIDATCTENGSITNTCTLCGSISSEIIPAIGHTYNAEVYAPTCTEGGYTIYTCALCSYSYTGDKTDATGHEYDAEVIEASCTENGSATYTCKCGHSYTEVIATTGHNFEAVITAPTCTKDGFTTYTCIVCSDSFIEDYVEANGHHYEAFVTAPTCIEVGFTTYTCACGDSYVSDQTDALGHHNETKTVAATCTENGSITVTCILCGNTSTEIITAAGHNYDEVVTSPSCTHDGFTTFTCGICNHSYVSDKAPALGHNYTTAETDGNLIHTCDRCGNTYSESINWVSLGNTYVLDTDGADIGENHKYIIVGSNQNYALIMSGATVGSAAVDVNGNTIILTDGSDYEFYFTDNSSRENGTYLLTQDGNNSIYHMNGDMYYGSDNKGYWYIGSSSNGSYQIYDFDNLNWYLNYGYVWASDSVSRFAVSSETRAVRLFKRNEGYARLAGSTAQICTNADGETESSILENVVIQTSTDGSTVSDTVPVTSSMVSWDQAFDGTSAGIYTASVNYNGAELGTITVSVTSKHEYETVEIAPTCTERGYTVRTCSECGVHYESDYIEVLGHSYSCTESDGYLIYTCIRCDDSYTEKSTNYISVNSIASGNTYVITLYSGNKYYAVSHANNSLSVVQIAVSNGEITSEVSEDLLWNYSGNKLSYTDEGTTYYLYASRSGWWGSYNLSLSTSSSSSVSFSNSKLKFGSYYLRYSSGSVTLHRSATTTYMFQKS